MRQIVSSQWREIERRLDGSAWQHAEAGLMVIRSIGVFGDGRTWPHVSVSRADRGMPTYEDLCFVKAEFVGKDCRAIEIYAPESEHVDIAGQMPNPKQVRHLWECLDEDPLPDFAPGGML